MNCNRSQVANSMTYKLLLILLLFTTRIAAIAQQCETDYFTVHYHNSFITNTQGDTLNKTNSNRLYEGIHVYTGNSHGLFNDTTDYVIGQYKNGQPIGTWKCHCKDGSYSMGEYRGGAGEVTVNRDGTEEHKQQGVAGRTGIWRFYNKEDSLVATLQYKSFSNERRQDWCDEVYTLDKNGAFILTRYEYNSKRHYKLTKIKNIFKRYVLKEYHPDGSPRTIERQGLIRSYSREYYASGRLKQKAHRRLFGGIQSRYYPNGQLDFLVKTRYLPGLVNSMTMDKYSEDGKLIKSRKGKYRYSHYR
jgi:MORN repeat variant